MARGISKENVKHVIDVLREKRVGYTQLEKESGVPQSSLTHILEYLEYWGLASKDKSGNWAWFLSVRTYETRTDFEVALSHSKELVRGFHWLATALAAPVPLKRDASGLDMKELTILLECARSHIRTGYDQLYMEIEAYESSMSFKQILLEEMRELGERYAASFLPVIHRYFNDRAALEKSESKLVEDLVKAWGLEKLSLLDEVDTQTGGKELQSISDQLLDLTIGVESGEPFEGHCRKCPRIRVHSS